jgi:hypothetical protein
VPLSEPAARTPMHTRRIVLQGYQREDGLFDIDAELTDTKFNGFANDDRGFIPPGEPLHGMFMRMTVNEDLLITGFEAATDYAPYAICPEVTPNFARLVGLRIGRGFLRAATERVGGTHGCTHLRELLQQIATVAFQTVYPVRAERASKAGRDTEPALLNTCYAYGSDSPVVQRRWPERYTGPI